MENRLGWLEFCEKKMSSLLGSEYIANPGQSQKTIVRGFSSEPGRFDYMLASFNII